MKFVSPAQMKEMDLRTVREGVCSSIRLMQNAAEALYREVTALMEEKGYARVVLLAGRGNNGGDAYALACLLHPVYQPAVLEVGEGERSPDCEYYYQKCLELGVPFVEDPAGFPLVVEGVFGTGFHGELPQAAREIFSRVNAPVVAIDLPGGMNGATGICAEGTLKPVLTVTFAYYKPCHLFADCGRVVLADIGIPSAYGEGLNRSLLQPSLPPRSEWGHKNSYGAVGLLVGAEEYPGAAALALKGALNSGAGLVFGYLPAGPRAAAAAKFYGPVLKKETDLYPLGCDAYLAGSGLGRSEDAGERVKYLWRAEKPLVVDGDGLWHLQSFLAPRKALTVLTPHLGEFARLLGMDPRAVAENRLELAEQFAKKYHVILVLKDAATVVTNGDQTAVLSAPCSALAKGGSGDLLAGLIAGLLAGQGDAFALVQTGVWLHNRAAQLAARAHSVRTLQPDRIADYLDDAWMELEHGNL